MLTHVEVAAAAAISDAVGTTTAGAVGSVAAAAACGATVGAVGAVGAEPPGATIPFG